MLADLWYLLSQLPVLLLLGDFSTWHHLYGSEDVGKKGPVIGTMISRFNIEPTHIYLASGNLFSAMLCLLYKF
jgi:hypothetical protein